MEDNTRMLLIEEIRSQLERISKLETGSDEKQRAMDDLINLYKLKNDESDIELKKSQLSEQKTDRYFKIGVELFGITVPLIFYAVWMGRGFKFEETGTFTSSVFKGLINCFRPTKR